MLIKVNCKKYFPSSGLVPKLVECHVNSQHIGFIGEFDRDNDPVEDHPLFCYVDVDGQAKKILFTGYDEYNNFIGQVMATCSN